MGILLHHLNNSRSERIFWLLEELELPYDVKVHYRTKEGKGPESLKGASGVGKAPAVEIDGRTFTESGAIIHLLLGKYEHAGLENAKKASYDSTFWSHFSEGSLMLNLQAAHTANLVNRGMSAALPLRLLPFFLRGSSMLNSYIGGIAAANVTPMLAEVDTFLADHEWFSGSSEIGEGDFMMIYPLHAAMRPQWPFKLGPNTEAWVRRVEQRPAYQKASERMMKEEADQSENPPAKL